MRALLRTVLPPLLLAGCVPRPVVDGTPVDAVGEPIPVGSDHLVRFVQVPSEAAGEEGVAVRIVYPDEAGSARWADGLPVVVSTPSGTDAGTFKGGEERPSVSYPGVVHVELALPGGGTGAHLSGGTYDERGERSIDAVADVLRFVGGEIDVAGQTFEDLVGLPLDPAAVGVLGVSNGGNIAAVTLATREVPEVCWLGLWETPVLDVFATVDFGAWKGDPDPAVDADGNGIPWDDMANPSYEPGACDDDGCSVTYPTLAWDGENLFRDGNGNGVLGVDGELDENGNGIRDAQEDFLFDWLPAEDGRRAYSLPVLQQAYTAGALGEPWPDTLLNPDEALDYWYLRSTVPHITSLPEDLAVIVVAMTRDHVQATPDHPHVRVAYETMRDRLAWVRLNPDAAYVLPAIGDAVDGLPDHEANVASTDAMFPGGLEPFKPTEMTAAVQLAAVLEMSDRCHLEAWDPDLAAPLAPVEPCPTCEGS